MDLNDKVSIVTGSARGIGRAIADKMAAYGATVVVCDLSIDNVRSTASELSEAHPDTEFGAFQVDVTRRESLDRLASDSVDLFGQIDILVNNAGIIGASGWENRDSPSEDDWDQIYEVNVKGVAKASDAVAEYMKERSYGKIVNIASVAGRQGAPGNPAYNASKGGRHQLDPSLRAGTRAVQHQRERDLPGFAVDGDVGADRGSEHQSRRKSVRHNAERALRPVDSGEDATWA